MKILKEKVVIKKSKVLRKWVVSSVLSGIIKLQPDFKTANEAMEWAEKEGYELTQYLQYKLC